MFTIKYNSIMNLTVKPAGIGGDLREEGSELRRATAVGTARGVARTVAAAAASGEVRGEKSGRPFSNPPRVQCALPVLCGQVLSSILCQP